MEFMQQHQVRDSATLLFKKWKSVIESEVPNSRVEHIGSTAINGAITKGDVDLYVEVPPECHEEAVEILENLGFRVKQDTHRDRDLCMLESADCIALALQVVARGSKYEFFVKFRDALNADEGLVERYNAVKVSCAGCSVEEYRRKKSVFINHVLSVL